MNIALLLNCIQKRLQTRKETYRHQQNFMHQYPKLPSERLKLTLQGQRLKCSQLEEGLNRMRLELDANSVEIDKELSDDFV